MTNNSLLASNLVYFSCNLSQVWGVAGADHRGVSSSSIRYARLASGPGPVTSDFGIFLMTGNVHDLVRHWGVRVDSVCLCERIDVPERVL
jgi:hypothetical protein